MSTAGGVLGAEVAAATNAADDLLAAAAAGPVWQCSDDEIEQALHGLDRIEARTAAVRAGLLVEADQRGLRERTGAPSTVRWLADRFRWSRLAARRRLEQAQRLAAQPVVQSALAAGSVTVEQAEVIATGLEQVASVPGVSPAEQAEAGQLLVQAAATLDPHGLSTTGRVLVETLTRLPSVDDPADERALARELERAEQEAQARETNRFRLGRRNGRLRGVIDFGTLGEAVAQEWARRLGKPTPGIDGFEDTRETDERLGDALVDAMAATTAPGRTATIAGGANHNGGCCPGTQLRAPRCGGRDDTVGDEPGPGLSDPSDDEDDDDIADAIDVEDVKDVVDGETDAAAATNPGAGCCAHRGPVGPVSPVALLTLTVTLDQLRAGLADAGRLDTGQTVSAAALRQLACDAMVIPAVMNGRSQVLDLGRTRRLFTPAQRRATIAHQIACAAPGCDRPPQACHVHHDWAWETGGPTDLDNGTLLCGYHHRMVHRQGWTVRRAANGYPELIPPATIDPQQRPRQHLRYQLLAGTALRR